MSKEANVYLKKNGTKLNEKEISLEELYDNHDRYEFRCPVCNCLMSINKRKTFFGYTIYFSSNSHAKGCEMHTPGSGYKTIKIGNPVLDRSIFEDQPQFKAESIENAELPHTSENDKKDPSSIHFSDELQKLNNVRKIINFLKESNFGEESLFFIDENVSIPCRDFLITDTPYYHDRDLSKLNGVHLLINPQKVQPKDLGLPKFGGVYCATKQPKDKKKKDRIYFNLQFISQRTEEKFKECYYQKGSDPSVLVILGDFKKQPHDKFTIYKATISDRCYATFSEGELPSQLLTKM